MLAIPVLGGRDAGQHLLVVSQPREKPCLMKLGEWHVRNDI